MKRGRNMRKKIISAIQRVGGKICGVNKTNEQVDSLYYFFNSFMDISTLPPAQDPNLRSAQLICTELLHVFDLVCKKHNLTYWLDSGTLLGAIRHNGFIPWDDDLDVAMPREDYNKLLSLTKDEMASYGIIVRSGGYFDNKGPMERLAFAYKTLETGAWLDIFPADSISTSQYAKEIENDLRGRAIKYYKFYTKHSKWDQEKLAAKKSALFSGFPTGENEIWFAGPEFNSRLFFLVDKPNMFPLKKHVFEGYEFSVPFDCDAYLKSEYGNYMEFPRRGVEGHADPNGNDVKSRIIRSKIDVEAEIAYLKDIAQKIEKS